MTAITNGIRKCNAKNRVSVALSTANPHTHWTISYPTYGIADSKFVITVAPQHDILSSRYYIFYECCYGLE
jgi:hypothetical protein